MPTSEKQTVTDSIYSVMSVTRTFISNLASGINSYIYQPEFSGFYSLMIFRKNYKINQKKDKLIYYLFNFNSMKLFY